MTWLLYVATLLSTTGSIAYVLLYLPPEATQGFAQKIFFFHVPSAFSMYACMVVGLGASMAYLAQRKKIFDSLAYACMVSSLVFGSIVIASGPIWAKPIWGVYWTWDPRLTTSFLVFVMQIAYLAARRVFDDRRQYDRSAAVGSILCVLAVLDIPLIHWSVKLWRGVHPSVLRNPEGLDPLYRRGLEVMTGSFFLLAALLVVIFFNYYESKRLLREKGDS